MGQDLEPSGRPTVYGSRERAAVGEEMGSVAVVHKVVPPTDPQNISLIESISQPREDVEVAAAVPRQEQPLWSRKEPSVQRTVRIPGQIR